MSTLHDAIQTKQAGKMKGPNCTVGAALSTLPKDEAADLSAALADPAVYHTTISDVLTERGHKIKEEAVARHRKGRCACRPA